MAPTSKNARKNRGSGVKLVVEVNGADVEVCPALFIGKPVGLGNYIAVQDKATKKLLLGADKRPLVWKTSNIKKKVA